MLRCLLRTKILEAYDDRRSFSLCSTTRLGVSSSLGLIPFEDTRLWTDEEAVKEKHNRYFIIIIMVVVIVIITMIIILRIIIIVFDIRSSSSRTISRTISSNVVT